MNFMIYLFIIIWGIAGLQYLFKFLKIKTQYKNPIWKDLALIKMRLQLMKPREFEIFCGELLMLQGYDAAVTKATQDEGKDIIIYHKDKSKTFVECKLYDAEVNSVISRPIAQKLVGAIRHEEIMKNIKANGIIMTTSRFTDEAKKYCKDMKIKMIDTDEILNIAQSLNIDDVLRSAGIMQYNLINNEDNISEGSLIPEQE